MTTAVPLDPILSPAVQVLWRGERSVQLEMGTTAVVVDGVDHATMRQLLPRRLQRRPAQAPDPDLARHAAFATLADAGFLWPRGADDDVRLTPPTPRLASELAALAPRHGEHAAQILDARRHCVVTVEGEGRCGPLVASLLAAAGVGRVQIAAAGDARLRHAIPGGTMPADEGRPLTRSAEQAVARAAPEVDTAPLPIGERPDLIVLAHDEPIESERRDAFHAIGCSHLTVRLGTGFGVVGPLVIPGLTSCLRCADLHRLDRDPAWNALAVQLATRPAVAAADVCLSSIVGGLAAMQALDYLDGGQPASLDGTLELHRPEWQPRRRSWPVHPDCDCTDGA